LQWFARPRKPAFGRIAVAAAQPFSRLHNKKAPGNAGLLILREKITPKSILRDHRAAERAVQADAQDVVAEARIYICTDEAARREREGPGPEAVEIH
jgi:hypothetical protein